MLADFDLSGRVAVVTGASRGLGAEIARVLDEAGASLALVARDGDALNALADELPGDGNRTTIVADLADPDAPGRVIDEAVRALGRVDILVNNAGTNVPTPALEVTPELWARMLQLNTTASFFLAQHAARHMRARGGGGRIITVTSQMAEVGYYDRAVYCATKSAVLGFSRAMAVELAPDGIRVNCVGPTFLDSPLARQVLQERGMTQTVLERIPVGRLGTLREAAAAVAYLASPAADLVTGHHLLVDGGWTAW